LVEDGTQAALVEEWLPITAELKVFS